MWDCGYRVLKGVEGEVCGIQCAYLVLGIIKILETHFFYNGKLQEENTFVWS